MPSIEEKLKQIALIICDMDGVLTDGTIFFDGAGQPFRAVHARDVTALTLWRLSGGKSAIVSGLGSKAIEAIVSQWQCDECYMWIKDKVQVCREIAEKHGLSLEQMAFLGDDIIDIRAMREVGLGVAVADAMPEALEAADIRLNSAGGKGPLRELVHMILSAQGRLHTVIDQYCARKNQ